MIDRTFSTADSDGDGKISGSELDALDQRMKDRIPEYDTNGDGVLEKSEMLEGIRKRMQSGGGGGGGRGPGNE